MQHVVCSSILILAISALGCAQTSPPDSPTPSSAEHNAHDHGAHDHVTDADRATAFAALSPEDRALAEAQGYCVVSGEPLGSMGTPLKVTLGDSAVFVCCKGCEKEALEKPDEMLAKAEELKSKVVAERD